MRNFPSTPCARRWSCDPNPFIPVRVRRPAEGGGLSGVPWFSRGCRALSRLRPPTGGRGDSSPVPVPGVWTRQRRASPRRPRPGTGQARCRSQGWKWSGGGGPLAAAARATPATLLAGESRLLPSAAVVFGQKVQTLDPVPRLKSPFQEVVSLPWS